MYSQVFADATSATATVPTSMPTPTSPNWNRRTTSFQLIVVSNPRQHQLSCSSIQRSSPSIRIFRHLFLEPDLRKVDFDIIKDLVEAAEKYCVIRQWGFQCTNEGNQFLSMVFTRYSSQRTT
ncbi:hypothetical protein K435DRAFT_868212 [Dendrothele bispora CBS 962.96]|uniref:Uncharacterized protein n=1 Tax=Dendrothele bispora (strain CBS 962.96) TaxID=1314807 RepID=A0A4S8LCD9_DENBC|nr:hypothetical protein K435DRAFT_868212 [Dendrothele bispora CBS 962.96]